MATPGQLVKVLADELGMPEPTLTQYDRNLVVAGHRSKGGRGLSAAKIVARDPASILSAILGSARVRDSVSTLERHLQTRLSMSTWEGSGIPEMEALPPEHSFVDALEGMISAGASGSLEAFLLRPRDDQKINENEILFPLTARMSVSARTNSGYALFEARAWKVFDVVYTIPMLRKEDGDSDLNAYFDKVARLGVVYSDLSETRTITAKTLLKVGELLRGESADQPLSDSAVS